MKNILLSLGLFTIILCCMFFSVHYLKSISIELQKKNQSLEDTIKHEDYRSAYVQSTNLLQDWLKYSDSASIFVNHTSIDAISNEIYRLTQYVKCEDKGEALASVHTIKFLLDKIIELEKVTVQNLL